MSFSEKDGASMRNRLHNLDLTQPEHAARYTQARLVAIRGLEDSRSWAYDDHTGRRLWPGTPVRGQVTVGIGFNMEAEDAKKDWKKALGSLRFFEDVKAGRRCLTQNEINKLLGISLKERLKLLTTIYYKIWHRLKANERLALELAHFNGPVLVGPNSLFFQFMHAYVASNNPVYLGKALHELAHRSNKRNIPGLHARHRKEAILLNSRLCPLYSKPHDPVCPERSMTVYLDDTIVPLGAQTWPAPPLDKAEYYIWRTQGDERVRPCHAARDGKVYRRHDTTRPHPGTEPGCRCWAAPLPRSVRVSHHPTIRKSAPPKHVADIEPFLPLAMTHLMSHL